MPIAQLIRLTVASEHRAKVLELQQANVRGSRQEPGCLRFDMGEAEDGTILLWEIFADQAALDAHMRSPHYTAWAEWRRTVPTEAVTRERIPMTPFMG